MTAKMKKNIMRAKRVKFGILLHENGRYVWSITDDLFITGDKIIDAGAESYDKKTETVPTKKR